jgi:hypothetical protein
MRISAAPASVSTEKVKESVAAESFVVELPGGLRSRVIWFTPRCGSAANRFAIYQEGHGGMAVDIGATTIDWLLARGWQVIAVDMPIVGMNAADMRADLQTHNDFLSMDDGVTSSLQLFLLPEKAIVDRIVEQSGADPDIILVGRSGGGWTTYVYGAMDSRVDAAIQVAGGRPQSERLDADQPLELGDFEQTSPFLFDRVTHEDAMIAAGSKGSLHIFNVWDPCCYRVKPDDPFAEYLRKASLSLGKRVEVLIDENNHDHSISTAAYSVVGKFLDEVMPGVSEPCAEKQP